MSQSISAPVHIDDYFQLVKSKSDLIINIFLAIYFIAGLALAFYYDTWEIAIGVGGLSLLAYYSVKWLFPGSNLYQYVLSTVLGIFMAQFIYEMHGLFEMHFTAFIASAILITYQNWRLQIPLALVVIIHHALFAYLQYIGYDKIYFTQLEYMSLETFIIHGILATIIFFICGLWAFQFKRLTESHIDETFIKGKLVQKEMENSELKKTNRELDKFVYSVSHDLRAPLKSMQGVVSLAKEDTQDRMMLENFDMLDASIKKLDGFIIDILDYSRNARLEVKKVKIDFNQLLKEITQNLKYVGGNNRQVAMNIKVNDQFETFCDRDRLGIVLNNLISNAVRYQNPMEDNPCIDIEINTSPTETEIQIADNGIGIDKKFHEKIFEMFYRVSTESIGSGLGLYIVKEAVNKLHGTIWLKSELGKGTTFHIKIPNN